jgi:predicted ATP-grasp superfamily ATP-dependent carboligase
MGNFDVLVTDSRYKHSLATIRSLGREGLDIATMSDRFSPSSFSKYSKKSFKRKNFLEDLINIIEENDIQVIIPIGYHSNIICSQNKAKINKKSKVLISNFRELEIASDKAKMADFFKKLKIPQPKTWIIEKKSDSGHINIKKDLVIKSSQEMKGKKVEYLKGKRDLKRIISRRLVYGTQIVQERIRGFGCGYFALCKNGRVLADFQHKRIRQYPSSGGVSSFSESFYDSRLENYGKKILKGLKWNGIAMIEFIFDEETKDFKAIEINPKFWGSLDLAIESGVNFPYLYYLAAKGEKFKKPRYHLGVKFQWVLPEDTLRIKTSKDKRSAKKEWRRDLSNKEIKKDISYIFNDPLPTIIRMLSTFWRYFFER